MIGVSELPPRTSPFDPGYDPLTLESHLEQSLHLISILKISMAGWLVADEAATRRKLAAAGRLGVPTVTGGGPFEVAAAQGQLPAYLDLCAGLGFTRVECGEGFTDLLARAGGDRRARDPERSRGAVRAREETRGCFRGRDGRST